MSLRFIQVNDWFSFKIWLEDQKSFQLNFQMMLFILKIILLNQNFNWTFVIKATNRDILIFVRIRVLERHILNHISDHAIEAECALLYSFCLVSNDKGRSISKWMWLWPWLFPLFRGQNLGFHPIQKKNVSQISGVKE